jgi:hypothetical protein
VSLGKDMEDPESGRPDNDEKEEHEEYNLPHLRMLAGPEIEPVSSVRCRQPVVCYKRHVEKPLEYTASE